MVLEMQKEDLQKISARLQLTCSSSSTACNEYSDTQILAVKGSMQQSSNDLLDPIVSYNFDLVVDEKYSMFYACPVVFVATHNMLTIVLMNY